MWLFGGASEESPSEAVNRLIDILDQSENLKELKGALSELEQLVVTAPCVVTCRAINPLFVFSVANYQGTTEEVKLVQLALNIVLELINPSFNPPAQTEPMEGPSVPPPLANIQQLVKEKENIAHLLCLVESLDYVTRYNVIQILTICLMELGPRVQQLILDQTLGVNRLKELINDDRDMIRTTVFLLIVHLTESSTAIQNIVAFDTFPKIFHVAREEGWVRGGTTVQDITLLIRNLLVSNPNNQRLFVNHQGLVSDMANLLHLSDQASGPEILIVSRMISVVLALARSKENLPHLHPLASQLLELTTSHHLSKLNLGPNDPEELLARFANNRLDCLEAFAYIIQNEEVIDNFPSLLITIRLLDESEGTIKRVDRQVPEYFLDLAVGSSPCSGILSPQVREVRLARAVLESFLRGNNKGQILFASMILNSQARSGCHFGRLLGEILFFSGEDEGAVPQFGNLEQFGTAISILTAILLDNSDVKLMFLDLKINKSHTLVEIMSRALLQAVRHKCALTYIVGLFRVLCTWCRDSQQTIQTLFAKSPELWDLIINLSITDDKDSPTSLLSGLPCVILAYCCEYTDTLTFAGEAGFIREVIQRKVGLDNMKHKLKKLSTVLNGMEGSKEPEAQFFDFAFVGYIADLVATLDSRFVKLLTSPGSSKAQSEDNVSVARVADTIKALERANAQLTEKVSSLQSNIKEKKKKMREMVAKLLEISQELDNSQTRKSELEALLRQNEASLPAAVSLNQSSNKNANNATSNFQHNDPVLSQQYIALFEEHEDLLVLVSEMDEELESLRKEKLEATLGLRHPQQKPNEASPQTNRLTNVGLK